MTVSICKHKKKHYFIIPEKFNDVELAVLQEEGLLKNYEKVVFVKCSPISYLHLYKKEEAMTGSPVSSYDIARSDEPHEVFDENGNRPYFAHVGFEKLDEEYTTISQSVHIPDQADYEDSSAELVKKIEELNCLKPSEISIHLDINKLLELNDAETGKAMLDLVINLHKKMEENKVKVHTSYFRLPNYKGFDAGKFYCDTTSFIQKNDVE